MPLRSERALSRVQSFVLLASVVVLAVSPSAGAQGKPKPASGAASKPARGSSDAGPGGMLGSLSFTSKDEPIVVDADQLEFDYDRNRLVYRGAVRVKQGDLELECKTLTVTYDRADELEKAQLREVVAEGNVVITQGDRRASGDRGVFDQTTRQIVLIGNPVLREGPNEVQGDRLTVYLDEGRSVIEASPKKRVSAILYPGQIDGAGAKGAPAGAKPAPGPSAGGKAAAQ
ncbi:MAG: lipopolysaccharide transport periplasmic protein LptA [Deltaproteobacteria bacterium]|nr:lipopolysaccharide transport periplasmic protein LptA [Deltaproteobacteria bacterium]